MPLQKGNEREPAARMVSETQKGPKVHRDGRQQGVPNIFFDGEGGETGDDVEKRKRTRIRGERGNTIFALIRGGMNR